MCKVFIECPNETITDEVQKNLLLRNWAVERVGCEISAIHPQANDQYNVRLRLADAGLLTSKFLKITIEN